MKRYSTIQMWYFEDKLNRKTALTSGCLPWHKNVPCLSSLLLVKERGAGCGWLGMCFSCSFARNYSDANSKTIVYLIVYWLHWKARNWKEFVFLKWKGQIRTSQLWEQPKVEHSIDIAEVKVLVPLRSEFFQGLFLATFKAALLTAAGDH